MSSNSILPSYLLPPLPVRLVNRKVKQITHKMWSMTMLRCNSFSEQNVTLKNWKKEAFSSSTKSQRNQRTFSGEQILMQISPTKIWEVSGKMFDLKILPQKSGRLLPTFGLGRVGNISSCKRSKDHRAIKNVYILNI